MSWINVKEKLPEQSGIYLVVVTGEKEAKFRKFSFEDRNFKANGLTAKGVSHWQPLPKLPVTL